MVMLVVIVVVVVVIVVAGIGDAVGDSGDEDSWLW